MQLLTDLKIDFTTIEYLKEPPTTDEVDEICALLGVEPTALVRTKEARFKELGLSAQDDRSRSEWLALMVENPVLIERPIVVINGQAVVGRPPDNIHTIL